MKFIRLTTGGLENLINTCEIQHIVHIHGARRIEVTFKNNVNPKNFADTFRYDYETKEDCEKDYNEVLKILGLWRTT